MTEDMVMAATVAVLAVMATASVWAAAFLTGVALTTRKLTRAFHDYESTKPLIKGLPWYQEIREATLERMHRTLFRRAGHKDREDR